jgi:hypothetical protein
MDDFTIRPFEIEIDKLTNSIENVLTGETFETQITLLTIDSVKHIKKANWLFDWKKELLDTSKQVYKLTTMNNSTIIQGLLSIKDMGDHIFAHLIESAKFNRGKAKIYLGVPANLMAFACKTAFEKGYDGYVAFDSKTSLVNHYKNMLGATLFRGQRMFIGTEAAYKLVNTYFKK